MRYDSEEKIRFLCDKVTRTSDPDELAGAVEELRAALREHVLEARYKLEDLAFRIAATSESKAAD